MKCRFCGYSLDKNHCIDYGNMPMTPNAVEKNTLVKKDGMFYEYEMVVVLCTHCGLIQQLNSPDPNILYFRFKNEVVGKKWERHFDQFSKFVLQNYKNNDLLLEVGAGDLQLTNILLGNGINNITVVEKIIDEKNLNPKINFINAYLEDVSFTEKFDIIYSSHVFEHIDNIREHLKKVSSIMSDGGHYIFSLPDFQSWVKNFHLNSFSQEHTIYPFLDDIRDLLRDYGLEIKKIHQFEGHSLFIDSEFSTKNKFTENQNKSIENSINLINNFKNNFQNLISFLNKLKLDKIYVFGANSSTQILLKNCLKNKNIISILDNSTIKECKYLYGFDYVVKNPQILENILNPEESTVLIFTGTYVDEIQDQINSINNKIKMITVTDFKKHMKSNF